MNKELLESFKTKSSDDLFYYFKHDGAINFEKKLIAGIVLKEKGYDKRKLSQEKTLIVESINSQLKASEAQDGIHNKASKKASRKLMFTIGYFIFLIAYGLKDYLYAEKEMNWIKFSVLLGIGILFIAYNIITYPKKVNQLVKDEKENNELLRNRLKLIDEHWLF